MRSMMNFGIPFKFVIFNHSHKNDVYFYVLSLFLFPESQANTVVYVFKERSYLLCLITIGTVLF